MVADNFEHVIGAAPFIGGLLEACPALAVLVTSREPLALHAEERYPVAPLALPGLGMSEDLAALSGVDAVVLFSERARVHDPGFELAGGNAAAVAEICRRVDGLPLAIELAAARCGLLAPREIAQRLDTALGALGTGPRDAPARQQTLRATVDWSYELLTGEGQACFARFGVFAGAPTVDAAEAITGADLDTLDSLVAKSLLVCRRPPDGPTRLAMLQTMRAYVTERFAATADGDAVRERHHRHHLALAERHGTDRALWGASHHGHLAELDASIDDLHGALSWAVRDGGAEPALALCSAVGWYWLIRDRHADAVEWSERALSLAGADDHPALCIRVLCLQASGLWGLGRRAELAAVMLDAEGRARAHADPVLLSRTLETRSVYEALADRLDVAEALADDALSWASAAADDWALAMAARARAFATRDTAQLHDRVARAASLLEQAGNLFHLGALLASASYMALGEGNVDDAGEFVGRALPIARRLDNPHLWMLVRGNLALTALLTGDAGAARQAFREELRLCRELVFRPFVSEGLQGLAAVATVFGDHHRAARLCGAAAAHRDEHPVDPVDARVEAVFFAPARTQLGIDAWNAALRDGAALGFEDAIAYVLADGR